MKKIRAILFSLFLVLGMTAGTVYAEEIDPDRSGSLKFTVHDPEGKPVGGGSLTVTKVADIAFDENGNPYFKLTPDFEGTNLDLMEVGDLTRQVNAGLIDYLEQYASDHGLLDDKRTVPADGVIDFETKEQGLYLVIQEEPHPGYKLMPAFLISVPQSVENADGTYSYIYDVNASPKSDPEKLPVDKPTPENPPKKPSTNKPPTSTETGANQYLGSLIISGLFLFLIAGTLKKQKNAAEQE